MCGIVGMAGDIGANMRKMFGQMLIVDQLRGQHSTGVLSVVNHNDKLKITKVLGGPENLDDSKSYNDQMTDYNKVMIGHNRWATSGKIIARNAHPFEFDTLAGVHNGSLRQYSKLPGHSDFPVDSEVLYHSIDAIGLQPTLDKITGAYTLVWWDKVEKAVKILRNSERPLYLAHTRDGKTIMWASEPWMISGIAERNGIFLSEDGVWNLKADTLLTIPLDTAIRGVAKPLVTADVKGGAEVFLPASSFRQGGSSASTTGACSTTGAASNESSTGTGASCPVTQGTVGQTNTQGEKKTEEVKPLEPILAKGRHVFVGGFKASDANGGKYINLFRLNDSRKYRLYLNKADYGKYDSGDQIEGEINSICVEQGTDIIYKMVNVTAKNLSKIAAAEKLATENLTGGTSHVLQLRTESLKKSLENLPEVPEEETGELYCDKNGRYITKEDFQKKYQFCDYCTDNIDPSAGYRFMKGGECLCERCMSDRVLVDSLS